MVPANFFAVTGGEILALEAPQASIDDPGQLRTTQHARRLDGLGHGSVIRHARVGQLEETDSKQCVDDAVAPPERATHELRDPCLQLPVIAQHAVGQHAHKGPIRRRYLRLTLGDRRIE